MSILLSAFLIGVIAGLRTLMAPTVVSWAASLGWLQLEGGGLAFLTHPATRYILSVLALGELVNDKLPKNPQPKGAATIYRPHSDGRFFGSSTWRFAAGFDRRPDRWRCWGGGRNAGRL